MMEESTKGRHEATGRGVMYAVEEACRLSKIPLRDARVVVQGFGNVGHIAAQMLFDKGARITAISDSQGGIFNSRGINPYDALKHKTSGSVVEMPGTSPISSHELLELDCDILIPAALENQSQKTMLHEFGQESSQKVQMVRSRQLQTGFFTRKAHSSFLMSCVTRGA